MSIHAALSTKSAGTAAGAAANSPQREQALLAWRDGLAWTSQPPTNTPSTAVWDATLRSAVLTKVGGKEITRFGHAAAQRVALHVEEAVCLADRRKLRVEGVGGGGGEAWGMRELHAAVAAERYPLDGLCAFAHLVDLGYTVRSRRGGDGALELAAPCCVLLDVWRPSAAFRRSAPGVPDFCVGVSDLPSAPPTRRELAWLRAECSPAALRVCVLSALGVPQYVAMDDEEGAARAPAAGAGAAAAAGAGAAAGAACGRMAPAASES